MKILNLCHSLSRGAAIASIAVAAAPMAFSGALASANEKKEHAPLAQPSKPPAETGVLPTPYEMLTAARESGLIIRPQNPKLSSDSAAWTFSSVNTPAGSEGKSPLAVISVIESDADLYLGGTKFGEKTVVFRSVEKGATFQIPGQMSFERVGLFTKTWKLSFKWTDNLPPGKPLSSFENPVIQGSPEHESLMKQQLSEFKSAQEAGLRKAADQAAAVEKNRSEAQARFEAIKEKAEGALESLAKGMAGKWLPYTVVTYRPDHSIEKSEFGAVRFAPGNDYKTPKLTIVRDPALEDVSTTVDAKIADGLISFKEADCQITASPGFTDKGRFYMITGEMKCPDRQYGLAIIPQERALSEIRPTLRPLTATKRPPATTSPDNNPSIPAPSAP